MPRGKSTQRYEHALDPQKIHSFFLILFITYYYIGLLESIDKIDPEIRYRDWRERNNREKERAPINSISSIGIGIGIGIWKEE